MSCPASVDDFGLFVRLHLVTIDDTLSQQPNRFVTAIVHGCTGSVSCKIQSSMALFVNDAWAASQCCISHWFVCHFSRDVLLLFDCRW